MPPPPPPSTDADDRSPLTPRRVLDGAVALADRIGAQSLTIRKLADELGVKPMTIYHHVDGKDAILDGMVDTVFGQIELPPTDLEWRAAVRARCVSARTVLNRHPWATPLMETRTSPGPATLRHHDAVVACLRRGGLSIEWTAHAYAILDSYVYGFALQEATLVVQSERDVDEVADEIVGGFGDAYPHLAELATEYVARPGYDFGASFELGLDLLLDGIEANRGRS
jgi:AcrR family transcriptional regulator